MYTPLSICNLGLGKIAASKCTSLDPPKSSLEKHCRDGYPQWRDSELSTNEWVFAVVREYTLTLAEVITASVERKYRYTLPTDMLVPLRTKTADWLQGANGIFSSYQTLSFDYVRRVAEAEFTALFAEVLSCRVAVESVEFATQSNTKGESADQKYEKALKKAARVNAVIIGSRNIQLADYNDSWEAARHGLLPGEYNG